jgi:hypothetical protein
LFFAVATRNELARSRNFRAVMMATLRALALALAAACLAPCQAAPQAMPKGAMLWVYR